MMSYVHCGKDDAEPINPILQPMAEIQPELEQLANARLVRTMCLNRVFLTSLR
jgi:hypothetical protein